MMISALIINVLTVNLKMYTYYCANMIPSHICECSGVVKPSHWGRQSLGRDGWQNDSSARGINARAPERQERRASLTLRVYTAARADMPRVFWVGHSRRKSLNLPSEYWKGDNRTVWGDFYSFWKWKGKLRCFISIFYSRKYILWLIRHVLRNAYCIHDDALWNGHVELL